MHFSTKYYGGKTNTEQHNIKISVILYTVVNPGVRNSTKGM